jgi:predicted nucleic acid-binding protein
MAQRQPKQLLPRRFQLADESIKVFVPRRWIQHGVERLAMTLDGFAEAVELPFSEAVWHQSLTIMTEHQRRSHDAIHAATARTYRVPCIATADAHVLRLRNLDVRLIRDGAPS